MNEKNNNKKKHSSSLSVMSSLKKKDPERDSNWFFLIAIPCTTPLSYGNIREVNFYYFNVNMR